MGSNHIHQEQLGPGRMTLKQPVHQQQRNTILQEQLGLDKMMMMMMIIPYLISTMRHSRVSHILPFKRIIKLAEPNRTLTRVLLHPVRSPSKSPAPKKAKASKHRPVSAETLATWMSLYPWLLVLGIFQTGPSKEHPQNCCGRLFYLLQ